MRSAYDFVTAPSGSADFLARMADFWTASFVEQAGIDAWLSSWSDLWQQAVTDHRLAADAVIRAGIPPFQRSLWIPLRLRRAARVSIDLEFLQYGDAVQYGTEHLYGEKSSLYYSYQIDASIQEIRAISDKLVNPSAVLAPGFEFILRNGALVLRSDPFAEDTPFQTQILYDAAGNEVDREALLWCYDVARDRDVPYRHFGYVFGLAGQDADPAYMALLNSLWDSRQQGMSRALLSAALSAITGIPLARGDESVQQIIAAPDGKLVVTDKQAYAISSSSNVVVSVGQRLRAGDALSDGLQIIELGATLPPDLDTIPFGPERLDVGGAASLSFPNLDSALTYAVRDGIAEVRFDVWGDTAAVDAFWERVHARGVADGRTLAQCLDIRPNPIGQPSPESLPDSVNPAELVARIIGGGMFLVRVRVDAMSRPASELGRLSYIRDVLPAGVGYSVLVDMSSPVESIHLSSVTEADVSDELEVSESVDMLQTVHAGTQLISDGSW